MPLTFESDSVRAHLAGLQSTVSRLAGNSAQCKTWAVTLTAALLVLTLEKGIGVAMPVAALPIFIFALLDAYYLSLERRTRNLYVAFADKVRGQATPGSAEALLFSFGPTHRDTSIVACLGSGSVWIFYLGLLILAVAAFLVSGSSLSTLWICK